MKNIRKNLLKRLNVLLLLALFGQMTYTSAQTFPQVRVEKSKRNFSSAAVDQKITEMQQKISSLIIEFTQKEEVRDYIGSIWLELKNAVIADLEKGEESKIKLNLTRMIGDFGATIQNDLVMTAKINDFIKTDLLGVLLRNKKAIGDLIASSVQSWDKKEIADKLELEVGKDLQFIRINGTVVGGFVGLVIYFVEQFL